MASEMQPILQLKDVYDIAQSVGEHFQQLTQRFGNASFVDLVNTVVNSLEHLETFIQSNQKLQARVCKLLLDNDSLLKENDNLKIESLKNAATLASLELINKEKIQVEMQLEGVREANKELMKDIEDIASDNGGRKTLDVDGNGGEARKSLGDVQSKSDAMEVPRMRRRLAQMENELKRTRTKLLSSQSTLKSIVTENNVLKAQVEESKAEIGLQTLQLQTSPPNHQEPPKFYKKDLLVVLRERNELKEQLDALRDELNMTRLQLRYHYQSDNTETVESSQNIRASTKVRDIVTSMTADSIREKRGEKRGQKDTKKSLT